MSSSIKVSEVDLFEFVNNLILKHGNETLQVLCCEGRLPLLEYINTNPELFNLEWSVNNMNCAAANGHLHVVKWLHENRPEGCTQWAMDLSAANGHLDVVKWLHENRTEGCTEGAMDSAARGGHLHVLKWLHENRTEGCTQWAMDWAITNGHFDVVKWLHENTNYYLLEKT